MQLESVLAWHLNRWVQRGTEANEVLETRRGGAERPSATGYCGDSSSCMYWYLSQYKGLKERQANIPTVT